MIQEQGIALNCYLVECPLGIFGISNSGKILAKEIFQPNPALVAERMKKLEEGEFIEELSKIVDSLQNQGCKRIIVQNEKLSNILRGKTNLKIEIEQRSRQVFGFRENLPNLAMELKFVKDKEEYKRFTRQMSLQLTRAAITIATGKRDLHAVQSVRMIDDTDKVLNLFAGRIREWYGLHFPELDRLVDKHETYIRLITKLGNRENFTSEGLAAEGIPSERTKDIAEAAARSMGADFGEKDLEMLQSFCGQAQQLYDFRAKAESHVESLMTETAPNLTAILGPLLAARLISIAGSLDNLAKMPASTVQVLGAEKALFRSLKTGTRPPKHGVIFQYYPIHQAPRWQRGKIARALAGKLAIAARVDAFGGSFFGESLRKDIEKKVEDIREKYKSPPMRPKHAKSRGRQR